MAENIFQIYESNPITTNQSNDLMYFGQAPYGASDDAAMTFANFNSQIVATGAQYAIGYYATAGNKISPLSTIDNGVLITNNTGVPSYLVNSVTPGFVLTSNSGAPPSWQPVSSSGAIEIIDGNTGTCVPTAGVVTINGGSTGLTTSGSGSTLSLTGLLVGANGGTGVANTGKTINLGSPTTGYVLTSDSSGNATWQSVSSGGAITTIDGDSGSVTPSSGVVTITGSTTGLTFSGASHTLSLGGDLVPANGGLGTTTAPTAGQIPIGTSGGVYTPAAIASGTNILVGNGSGSITIGITGTIGVTNGGTGKSTLTTNTLLAGGTTSTGAIQQVSSGTSGQLLQSNGSSSLPSWTTATFPASAGAAGTILRSDGTNWVASTATFANTYTASNLLYSNGSNTVTGLATANNALLVTNGSGVPSIGNAIGADIAVNGLLVGRGSGNSIFNAAFGDNALGSTTGAQMTAVGYQALGSSSGDCSYSVAIGCLSLNSSTADMRNTAIGTSSFQNLNGGGLNTGVGNSSGTGITTGSGNTFIGQSATGTTSSCTGAIAIGASSQAPTATGITSGTNGPGIAIGSIGGPVGFRGDGSIYPGFMGAGNWRVVVNGTAYKLPLLADAATSLGSLVATNLSTSPANSASSTLALGTAYQNTLGYDVILTVYINVTSATSASILCGVGSTNTPTQQTIVSGLTIAALSVIPITVYLPNNYYALISNSGTITDSISGQQVTPV